MSDAEGNALVAMVIWTLRVFLPILLFILYYRVSLPGAKLWPFAGKHRRSRQDLLLYRLAMGEKISQKPESFKNFRLVDATEAPHLFVKRTRVEGRTRVPPPGGGAAAKPQTRPGDAPEKPKEPYPEEMLHLESLLNYMAFNRKQHRIFHPTEVPPPPSSPHPPMNGEPPSSDFQAKANLDAQMVLKGAVQFKKHEVVHDVYESLTGARVQPAEKTFALMVDGMINANDLPKASEYLMKMEQGGFAPDASLLDKVMELYARHKLQSDLGAKLSPEADEAEKIGLSIEAAEFIPEFTPGGGFEPGLAEEGAAAPWLGNWGDGEDWAAADPQWGQAWNGSAEDGEQGPEWEWSGHGDEWEKTWTDGDWWSNEWKPWMKDKAWKDDKEGKDDKKDWKEWGNKDAWKPGKGTWNQGKKGAWTGKGAPKGGKKWTGDGKPAKGKGKDEKDSKSKDAGKSASKSEGKKSPDKEDKKAPIWREKKAEAEA